MNNEEIVKYANEVIPSMTDPLGKYWSQPELSKILIGEVYAAMSQETFNQLKDYSLTNPTGVYEGKMWRSQHNQNGMMFHYLHWWENSEDPDKCKHHTRKILIV